MRPRQVAVGLVQGSPAFHPVGRREKPRCYMAAGLLTLDWAPMCFSAQIKAEYKKFVRMFGALLSLKEFAKLYEQRQVDARIKIPKAMDALFMTPQTDIEEEIRATEDVRIATNRIEATKEKLADLSRVELLERDARIFPGVYAPVMVWEAGQRVIKPMRYQCRPAGKLASHDTRYPGTYSARRDNLEGFWKDLFGCSHGLLVMNAFYENVQRDGRNVVLEFRPRPEQDMLVACLWSRWCAPGEPDLVSFAVITDEPPPEIAAAGHDRCIIPIRPQNVDAWLQPDRRDLRTQNAILEERERPYYEHRLAA